jgi:hypothetical protein
MGWGVRWLGSSELTPSVGEAFGGNGYNPLAESEEPDVGFWEGFVPVWGNGKQAWYNFANGDILLGLSNTYLAATDAVGVGVLGKMVGTALVKNISREAISSLVHSTLNATRETVSSFVGSTSAYVRGFAEGLSYVPSAPTLGSFFGSSFDILKQAHVRGLARNAMSVSQSAEAAVNPRLVQRLQAWRSYRAGGGSMSMAQWVKSTQGNAAYGTGFRSGYASWIRSIESTHGNSALSSRMAYLYRMEDARGNFLKWGVTQDLNTRYTGAAGRRVVLVQVKQGRRADMLRLERDLVETFPGPLNNELWAGARIGGW